MRYKTLVEKKLEESSRLLATVIQGMDSNNISAQDAFSKLKSAQEALNKGKEYVNLEHEG